MGDASPPRLPLLQLIPMKKASGTLLFARKPVGFCYINGSQLLALGLCTALAGFGLPSARAASATWDGGASTNVLNTAANWTGDTLPSANNEVATWDGTVPGDLSLVWSGNFGPTSGNSGGVSVNVAATNTGSLTLDATSGNFGLGTVTIASGAGAFAFGDGVGTASVVLRAATAASSFTNNSSNTATVKSDVSILNGGGVGGRVITFDGSGNWSVEGAFITAGFTSAGSASLVKNGAGTLTLAGANVHGGGTTLNNGVLAVTHGSALGNAGNAAVNGSFGTRLELSNNITLSGPVNINLTGRNNVVDNTSSGASIRNVSGSNSIASNLVFANVGGTNLNILSTAGTLTLNGTISTSLATAIRTFNFTGAGDIVANGVVSNGSGTVGVIKNGTGTLTLAGANSFTGGTTISEGTLAAGNATALGSGPLSIVSGTLSSSVSGLSSVGNVTFSAGDIVLNSSGVGSLGLANGAGFTMSGGTWSVSIASASSYDQVLGTATGGFNLTGGSIALDGISDYGVGYSLLDGFGSGSVSGLSITGYDTVNWVASLGTDGVLSFSAIPEPSCVAGIAGLTALGLGIARRRRAR